MQQSRLSRRIENKTKRRLILNILGTLIVLFLLIKFGIPLLINFSEFLSSRNSSPSTAKTSTNSFLPAPVINPMNYTATNSATISLTGSSASGTDVQLYVNNNALDTTSVSSDGSFHFDSVTLNQGDNSIQVKAKKDKLESSLSSPLLITYQNKAPSLSIDNPSDGSSFSHDQNTVVVKGKTDPDDKVTVNGFWAVSDSNGNYSYTLQLQNGDNQITVDSTDSAGNKTEKTLKVTYSQ